MLYHIFVLQKESKFIEEVIRYLQSEDLRPYSQERDFLDEQGILSAPMSSEEATLLKLKFPFISILSQNELEAILIESLNRNNPELLQQIEEDIKSRKQGT